MRTRCDQTPAWTQLNRAFETAGKAFDLRNAFAADPRRFASFSQAIKASRLFLGYDSVGQHAAAAMGVPQVTAFRGWIGQRMLQRWTPWGLGIRKVVPLTTEDSDQAFQSVAKAVDELLLQSENRPV